MIKLLSYGSGNPKLIKSDKAGLGYLSAIMYLAPHKLSGHNVCPHASPGCIAACLNTSGHGRYGFVQKARLKRTKFYFKNRIKFLIQLKDEIAKFTRKCEKKGLRPAIRLNGTSDIPWEKIAPELFTDFSMVQFYDYTKNPKRMFAMLRGELPKNYHLTFSRSETNELDTLAVLKAGGSVAVVFSNKKLIKKWKGFKVFNADENDLRFLDKKGVQGLYAKGRAKYDSTDFVVKT